MKAQVKTQSTSDVLAVLVKLNNKMKKLETKLSAMLNAVGKVSKNSKAKIAAIVLDIVKLERQIEDLKSLIVAPVYPNPIALETKTPTIEPAIVTTNIETESGGSDDPAFAPAPTGDELAAEIKRLIQLNKVYLTALPHPNAALNEEGFTLYSFYRHSLAMSNDAGKARIHQDLVAI